MKQPNYNRTYLPGYDLGNYLTLKNKPLYTVIKIKKITGSDRGDDLTILCEVITIKEYTDPKIPTPILRWYMGDENQMTYSNLLKDYRPLTTNEILLYVKE